MSRLRSAWPWVGLLLLGGLASLLVSLLSERSRLEAELTGQLARAQDLRARLALETSDERLTFAEEDLWAARDGQGPEQRLQAFALDTLDRHGQSLLRYEQVTLPQATQAPVVALSLEFEGSLEGLTRVLRQFEEAQPALAVERLSIRARSDYEQVEGQTLISSQLVVWGFADATPR